MHAGIGMLASCGIGPPVAAGPVVTRIQRRRFTRVGQTNRRNARTFLELMIDAGELRDFAATLPMMVGEARKS